MRRHLLSVLREDLSVNDNSKIPSRDEQHDFYGWSRDAARLIIRELGLDEDTILKAYFGDDESRVLVEKGISDRFHCTLDDLSCLAFKHDMAFTEKVIKGEKVELTIKKTTNTSVIEKMGELTKIFPNVSIIDGRK